MMSDDLFKTESIEQILLKLADNDHILIGYAENKFAHITEEDSKFCLKIMYIVQNSTHSPGVKKIFFDAFCENISPAWRKRFQKELNDIFG